MGRPLYFSHPACLEHETPGGHPERPARITAIEWSLAERGWLGCEVREGPPASRQLLGAVQSAEYVDAVRSMSDRADFAAFAGRDLDAMLSLCSPDVVLRPYFTAEPLGRRDPYRGHDGIRAMPRTSGRSGGA
jgi:acetoin utilization deacetylase AcuC-like enzyme